MLGNFNDFCCLLIFFKSTFSMLCNFACCFVVCWIFSKSIFKKKILQEYHYSIKLFGSRSGLTFCQAWSGSKLIANVISRQHWQVKSKTCMVMLDSRQRGCRFKPHWRHCIMSMSKTHLSLLSTGSTQSRHNWKIVDWDVKNKIKQTKDI